MLLVKVRVVNTSAAETAKASLRLSTRPAGGEELYLDNDLVMARHGDGGRLRFLVRGAAGDLAEEGGALRWSKELAPGAAHELEFLIPTITLDKPEEIDALRKRDFEADCRRICRFWEELTARVPQITTPEPWLNDFYKAVAAAPGGQLRQGHQDQLALCPRGHVRLQGVSERVRHDGLRPRSPRTPSGGRRLPGRLDRVPGHGAAAGQFQVDRRPVLRSRRLRARSATTSTTAT